MAAALAPSPNRLGGGRGAPVPIPDDATLQAAAAGDPATLASLDAQGWLAAPGESLADYVARLRHFVSQLTQFAGTWPANGERDWHGLRLRRTDQMPPSVFAAPGQRTWRLYGFRIDWVPGFFTSQRLGLLFAGCAWGSVAEGLTLFIIRQAFREHERWLIYSREELVAHELCHVARLAFGSVQYEEFCAYQTSTSAFRRAIGGLLRSPLDTYLLLGAALGLALAQGVNVMLRPPADWYAHPMPLIFGVGGLMLAWVFAGYLRNWWRWRVASGHLAALLGPAAALPVLFRCADAELVALAGLRRGAIAPWLRQQAANDWRWAVILHRWPVIGEVAPA